MAHFTYRARTRAGELIEGRFEGQSASAVAGHLQASGAYPLEILEVAPKRDLLAELKKLQASRTRISLDDMCLFCRQMYTLVKAGVPLVQALKGLEKTIQNATLAAAVKELAEDLETGRELSAAMNKHPKVFPVIFTSMIQVGEGTGRLDHAFLEVAKYLSLEKETSDRVKSALRYPTFVVLGIVVALAILSLFVIPSFEKVFAKMGAELPLPTRILMGISAFSVNYWPYILGLMVVAFFGLRHYLKTPEGALNWDRHKLRLPLAGSIILRSTMTRFARSFAMGYGAGIPLVQALKLTSLAVDNRHVARKLGEVREAVERGDTLTRACNATGLFTPLVLQMLAVGEESGSVDTMLLEVAEFYEKEVEHDLKKLTASIEPIMVSVMGVMVLILALGIFLPMWNLASAAKH